MSLVDEIGYFLARTRMDERAFGRLAVGDSEQVEDLRQGADITGDRAQRLRRFMSQHLPDDPAFGGEPDAVAVPVARRPIEDHERRERNTARMAAASGCAALHRAVLDHYEAVARRDGLTLVEACVLLNHGPDRFQTWRASQ